MTDKPSYLRPVAPGVTLPDPLPKPAPASCASSLYAQAVYLAGKEVEDLLKAADALQDRINTVRKTGLAPVGVLELVERFQRVLIPFSNNVQSLSERVK